MAKIVRFFLLLIIGLNALVSKGQNILPTPLRVEKLGSVFGIQKEMAIAFDDRGGQSAEYLRDRLQGYVNIKLVGAGNGDIVLAIKKPPTKYGDEGYWVKSEVES